MIPLEVIRTLSIEAEYRTLDDIPIVHASSICSARW